MLNNLFQLIDIKNERKEKVNLIYYEKYNIIKQLKNLNYSQLEKYYLDNPKLRKFDLLTFNIHDLYVIVDSELEVRFLFYFIYFNFNYFNYLI